MLLKKRNSFFYIVILKAEADMENLLVIDRSSSATRMDVPFAVHKYVINAFLKKMQHPQPFRFVDVLLSSC